MWIYSAINLLMVLVGVLTVLYLYIRQQFTFWTKKNVPFIKPHLFFGNFGNSVRMKTPVNQVLTNLYNGLKGERFGGVWQIFSPKLFIMDPELVRDILVKDFGTWSDRSITINLDVDPLAEHLANLKGKKWKSVRSKLTPTFTSARLKQMHYLLLECGKDFEKYLDSVVTNGEPVEAREMNAKFTTDVIGSCAFGIQMNSLNDEDALFRKMGKKIFQVSFRKQITHLLQTSFPRIFKFLKLSTISKEISEFFLNVTKQTFDYREKNNVKRHDFMDLLKNLKNTGEPLSEDEVEFNDELLAAQAFVFFVGGFETSSTTVSYTFHELAVNQDIQNRLREEVHRTKAANNGEITWDGLKSMKYLDMIVQETLRKYPIVPRVERTSVKPYRIRDTNVNLPSGTTCIIPIYGFHHDPEYYPDPEKFDPERFTEEAKSKRPACTFIPFGNGPRACIGSRFAEQQMKVALVKAVDTYKISLCEKSQNPLQFKPNAQLLNPEIGIWLKISKNIPT